MEGDQHSQGFEQMHDGGKLNELRKILTGLDKEELERLHRLMSDPHEFAIEISEFLPFSIRKLIDNGEISKEELLPFFEEIIQTSIQKNPQKLADILFPVMGPAIRKAVAEDLKKLIDSLNQTLESGLSPRHLKMRLSARVTGKSYAEMLLSQAYVYQVKQVFLIHRNTGLLLHHETDSETGAYAGDMVASMLSAIGDFVKDSFQSGTNDALDTIHVGELNIWIEQGPHAVIAAIVEGNPPQELRTVMKEAIEAVHFNHVYDFEKFNGDVSAFALSGKFLQRCLQKQKKEQQKSNPVFAITLLVLLVGVAGFFIYRNLEARHRWNKFVTQVDEKQGIHVTGNKKSGGIFVLNGLRDAEALNTDSMLQSFGFDSSNAQLIFTPFISLEQEMVVKRAIRLLEPPPSVAMTFNEGALIVSGETDAVWLNRLKLDYVRVVGVNRLDVAALTIRNNLPDLNQIIQSIEKHRFTFDINDVEMDAVQKMKFDSLTMAAVLIGNFNSVNHRNMLIHVRSYSSKAVNKQANEKVALERARAFIKLLGQAGVSESLLKAEVVFNEDLPTPQPVRSVSFNVFEE